jgi:hypothetical protein
MPFETMIASVITEIKQKLMDFCNDLDESSPLTPELSLKICTGLKSSLAAGGIAGLKTFLEDYDIKYDKVVVNGQTLYCKQSSIKTYLTAFGNMELKRNVFQANKGGKAFIPIDAKWGMMNQFATSDVRDALLFGASDLSPRTAEIFFKKACLFHPSHTAIENIINETGEFLSVNETDIMTELRDNERLPVGTEIIVESLDGANVRLREAGLRNGRPVENPGKDDSKMAASCFKNAMVGSLTFHGELNENNQRNRLQSIYLAKMPEKNALEFKTDLEAESRHWQAQMNPSITRMTITDGAIGIWHYLDNNPNYQGIPKLLDYYHATEHLGNASEALFGKSSCEGKQWYSKWKTKLKEDNNAAEKLCRSIEYYQTTNLLSKNRKVEINKQLTFFRRNKKRMNYLDFINAGLPIGSGPVEAACKTIVKQRMCRSGMRWSIYGGQPILSIRSIIKSQRWDQFWKLIVAKQHQQMSLVS